jgi:hypothetical protein
MPITAALLALLLAGCSILTPSRDDRVPAQQLRVPLALEEVCFARSPERLVRGRTARSQDLIVIPCPQ